MTFQKKKKNLWAYSKIVMLRPRSLMETLCELSYRLLLPFRPKFLERFYRQRGVCTRRLPKANTIQSTKANDMKKLLWIRSNLALSIS